MGANIAGHSVDESGALKMIEQKEPVLTDEQRGLLLVVPSLRNNENG